MVTAAETSVHNATSLARAVASFGLPGAPPGPVEFRPQDARQFEAILIGERLTGLAVAAVESGWLMLPEEAIEQLHRHHLGAMQWVLTLERRLLGIADVFDRAGIDLVVLKGPALAHTIYPDPSWRSFADIDILVRTADWEAACGLLEDLGFRRRLPEPRPGFDERFGKAAAHVDSDGVEVDLHRTLVLGPFGLWLRPSELFDRLESFTLGGRTFRKLDPSAVFMNVSIHASLGLRPVRLVPLRDVVQVAWTGMVDWDQIVEWGDRWHLAAVFQHTTRAVWELLGVRLPAEADVILRAVPSRQERRALAAYTTEKRTVGAMPIATLYAIPGARQKSAYIASLLLPTREFLAARAQEGGGSYLRRWRVPITWVTARSRARR